MRCLAPTLPIRRMGRGETIYAIQGAVAHRFAVTRNMEESIIMFLFYLRRQGAARTTMLWYRSRLARAARVLRCPVERLDRDSLARYAAWLQPRLRPDLMDDHLQALGRFLDWAVEEGLLGQNPSSLP